MTATKERAKVCRAAADDSYYSVISILEITAALRCVEQPPLPFNYDKAAKAYDKSPPP